MRQKEKHGRLIITSDIFIVMKGLRAEKYVTTLCECGTIKNIKLYNIDKGITKSCGCYHRERARETNIKYPIAGTSHPLYRIWRAMNNRCYNTKDLRYQDWGGRGITVCDEWRKDYLAFSTWALAAGWRNGLQIDRKNNDGNYSSINCKFSTPAENSRNRRSNKLTMSDIIEIKHLSKTETGREIGRLFNVSATMISNILNGKSWREEPGPYMVQEPDGQIAFL